MKTVEVSKKEVLSFLRLELISEIQSLSKSIELFEKKYGKSFEDFEKEITTAKERVEEWDDYIEWKAYKQTYKDRIEKLRELERAEDIKIITR
jgi:cytochrome c556